jgi:glycosyltransferase involved in cell wall biosynthesis
MTADDRQEHLARLGIFLDRELARSQGQLVVIFSAVPLILSEGQRATGLAKAFAKLGIPVVFAAWRWFPRQQPSDVGDAESLLQIPLDVFVTQAEAILQPPASRPIQGTLLIEFPHPSLFRVLNMAGAFGWTTVYDVIDDWEAFHQVGQAIWYDPQFESYLLYNVDHVIATSQALADKMVGLGARRVPILGNAYEGETFGPSASRKDLPRGEITVGYFGHLSRSWFDWEAVHHLAASRPAWSFHIIGYGDGPESPPPDNVLLLGKVPHNQLPEYAANWDVALIPFRPGNVSRAVDPVKIYEYLALGLPVVTQGMPHLEVIPGVRNAESAEAMAVLIEQAAKAAFEREAVRDFLRRNTWPQRARAILDLRGQPSLNPLWQASAHPASHG